MREADNGRPLRVCAVIQAFRPTVGGAELQLERLLPLLRCRGVSVTVLTRGYPGRPRVERIHDATVRRGLVAGRSPFASLSFIVGSLTHLALHRRSFDLVHSHGALSEGAIALGARLLALPAAVKVLRTGPFGDFATLASRPLGRARARLLVGHVWFIAVSKDARAELEGHGVRSDRIFDIPNGVDTAAYSPGTKDDRRRLRTELGLPDGALGLFVGRLDPVKRVDLVIEALAYVDDVELVVVGDGPDRTRLERVASTARLGDRVRFTGLVDNVADYLRAADAFLLPSRGEGMSNALLEAMACGLACAAAPAAGVRQLLADGRGLVVEAEAPAAWGAALRTLVGDTPTREQLGASAAEYVRLNYGLASTADKLVSAYRRLLAAA